MEKSSRVLSDEELIVLCRKGDKKSLETLVTRYRDFVYNISIQPIFQIPNSIRLSTLASALSFGKKGFEFSKIPLQKIITDIEEKKIKNILRKTFKATDIGEAHRVVESNAVNGKVVIQWQAD